MLYLSVQGFFSPHNRVAFGTRGRRADKMIRLLQDRGEQVEL